MKKIILLFIVMTSIADAETEYQVTSESADSEVSAESEAEQQKPVEAAAEQADAKGVVFLQAPAVKRTVKQKFSETVERLMIENELPEIDVGQGPPSNFKNACDRFFKQDGSYGDWGQYVIDVFNRYPAIKNELLSDSAAAKAGMQSACPKFAEMNEEKRIDFWVWTLASLAFVESTCGGDTRNSANLNAVGIFQLNARASDRKPRSSITIDGLTCATMTDKQVATHGYNIACTLDFMRDGFTNRIYDFIQQLNKQSKKKTNLEPYKPGLFSSSQQWEKLRSQNSSLMKLIREYQVCH